jgi:bifunctional DNA-binding transcriptional regulator/antitoxin component of YhaV-PrlF toxin-antitoxin module
METKDEIKFSGMINPKEGIARFQEKLDIKGRIQVPRMVRDKLGLHDKEALLEVRIGIKEIYPKESAEGGEE